MRPAVQRENEPATRGEFTDITRQNRASGHLREQDMKFRREAYRQRLIVAPRVFFLVHMRFKRLDLLFAQTSGKPRHDQVFDPKPDIKSIAGLFPRRRRYSGPTIATQFHEPFSRKLTQRTAHDRAASAETFADGVFRKFRARLQRLLDDRVAQSAIDRPRSVRVGFCLRPGHGSELSLRDALLRVSAAYDNVRPICVG